MNQKYTIKLIKKETVAEGTTAFYFNKPDGFEYKAGQNADYFLINPPETDAEGNKRTFSFVSSPSDSEMVWATRMRDTAFKRVMKNMPEGTEIEMEGPYGDMTLHNKFERPAVFLAGGIGITPFHSMVKDAAEKKLPHKIFLFFSNRRPEDAAFLQELTDLQNVNPNYKLITTMTHLRPDYSDLSEDQYRGSSDEALAESDDRASAGFAIMKPWDGERGYITAEMMKRYVSDLNGPVYYIAGPATMLSALHTMLTKAGINDDDIRREEFSGY